MTVNCPKPYKLEVKMRKTGARFPSLRITSPRDCVKAVKKLIGDNAYETFLVLYLNNANCVIGYEELTSGGLGHVDVVTSSLVRNALLAGARAVVTAHQHPSGVVHPSDDDRRLWSLLREQCELMGITLLDNLIVTENGYFSEMDE